MKRTFAVLLFVITAFTSICFVGCKPAEQKECVGIISAMENEMDALLAKAKIDRTDKIGNSLYYVGTLCGKSVVITKAGIGKVHAASGVTTLIGEYDVTRVLFTGIAGGVADETEVLDEVIATSIVEHDYGIITNDGFIWRSGDPGIGDQEGVYYKCDPQLVELAYNAAVGVVGKEHVFKGVIATGDQFIASEKYVERLKTEYNAYACEMEGAAIAAICIQYGKPFVIIRALSDKADGNAHESYENFGDIAGDNSSRIVLNMLENM